MRAFASTAISEDLTHVLSETNATPIRTRGPFRTRSDQIVGQEDMALSDLVAELREIVTDLPLTIVIHGWETPRVVKFVREELVPLLDERDGLWLVSSEQPEGEHAPGVELDLTDVKNDKRLYRMLVGDLVFFTGQETDVRIEEWACRARRAILDERGDYFTEMVDGAQSLKMVIYQRTEEGVLREL